MVLNNSLHSVHTEYPRYNENEGTQQQPVGNESEEIGKSWNLTAPDRISLDNLSIKAPGRAASSGEQMSSALFPMSRKRLSALTVSKRWKKVSHQLHTRKLLFEKRKRISDFALAVGMLGIIIMIIENELASAGVYTKV
jgi:hypothetical protein